MAYKNKKNNEKFYTNDNVLIYNKWKGIVKGFYSADNYIVQYTKHNNVFVGIVNKSRLKKIN